MAIHDGLQIALSTLFGNDTITYYYSQHITEFKRQPSGYTVSNKQEQQQEQQPQHKYTPHSKYSDSATPLQKNIYCSRWNMAIVLNTTWLVMLLRFSTDCNIMQIEAKLDVVSE